MNLLLLLFGVVLATKRREIRLAENAQVGTVLLNLLDDFYSGDTTVKRRFSVQQQARGNLVEVDSDGNVKLKTEIDHEKLCSSSVCHFTHMVRWNTSDVAEHIAIFSVFKNAHINHIEHFHSICQNHTPVTFFQSTKDIIDKSVVCLCVYRQFCGV